MIVLSIIVFILILGLLVFAHEFGHFIVAKKAGMQVLEFAFGFGPRLFSFKRGETTYAINALPLGGYVKIVGENNEEEGNPRSFINQGFWLRLATLVAGVMMNVVLAWILFSIGFGLGLPTIVGPGDKLPAKAVLRSQAIAIVQVAEKSPASEAGIKEGDEIIAVDNSKFHDYEKIIEYTKGKAGKDIELHLKRGSREFKAKIRARENPPADQGPMGVALAHVGRVAYPWYFAPIQGFKTTLQASRATFSGFWNLITSGQGIKEIGGPIRIAALTDQVTNLGLVYVVQFAAFLSINLAILNMVPFPALDGGRVLFLVIEKIRGQRNNQKVEQIANTIGFVLLMILIIIISIRDVRFLIG